MQGETGSLHDLKRYHSHREDLVPTKILEESDTNSDTNDSDDPDTENLALLREFQLKILSTSKNIANNRPRSGRRHTLCLTR